MSSLSPQHLDLRGRPSSKPMALYDKYLVWVVTILLSLGILMVASTSIVISEQQYHTPFHYLYRQLFALFGGLGVGVWVLRTPVERWQRISVYLLLASVVLLVMVLLPGIGHTVNGSRRWIHLGFMSLQASECVKLALIIYLSDYLDRHLEEVRQQWMGLFKPLALLGIIFILLLKEPDFGAMVVILLTALGMLFLGGVKLSRFALLFSILLLAVTGVAIMAPYRLMRLTTFLHPWSNPFGGAYQLVQSLIAFGQGGWWGVGLGNSLQKLFYLPEAHTDFLFAVLVEELGLFAGLLVIVLFAIFIVRALMIARRAQGQENYFAAFVSYGLALWLGLQTIINIGVNVGLLPTKGLTLPLMSYGGSSLLLNCIAVAMLLRIDHETRWHALGMHD